VGQVDRRQQVGGEPGGHPAEDARAGRGHQQEVAVIGEVDMQQGILPRLEHRGEDPTRGEGLQGQRGDEAGPRLGEHHIHLVAVLAEQTEQIDRPVGRNRAADPEDHVHG